jgi:hypothetical protein
MGSLITTLFCIELQLEQSNSRCSNPIGPGLMLVSFIRNVHCGQRGRSIGVSRGMGENCNFDMTLPCKGGSVTDSRSPMVTDGGAAIESTCRNAGLASWSILLTHQNLMYLIAPKSREVGHLSLGVMTTVHARDLATTQDSSGRDSIALSIVLGPRLAKTNSQPEFILAVQEPHAPTISLHCGRGPKFFDRVSREHRRDTLGSTPTRPDHLAYSYVSDAYRRIKATLVGSISNARLQVLH